MTVDTEQAIDKDLDEGSASATAEIGAANGKASRKPRGKGIIYFGLREADEALRKIDPQAKKMSRQGFAVALGHKKPENRFAQKVEALRTFTLVEEDGDDIKLTPLATDMLYAGSESARNQARSKAFLAYPDFQRTFIECPKGQDHPLSYVREYVTGKLGIINESDRFLRLFLEAAHFAGLLEGDPDAKAERIRLRPSTVTDTAATRTVTGQATTQTADQAVESAEAAGVLNQYGLSEFSDRMEVFRAHNGTVKTITEGGKLTVELQSSLRLVVHSNNVIDDLVRILNVLKEKGFRS